MALLHFSKEGFEKALSSGQLVFVDFWAEWCGPCRMVGPVIDKLAEAYEGKVLVGKVDIESERALAIKNGVMSIPTMVLFKDGKEVARRVGLAPGVDPFQDLSALLDQYL